LFSNSLKRQTRRRGGLGGVILAASFPRRRESGGVLVGAGVDSRLRGNDGEGRGNDEVGRHRQILIGITTYLNAALSGLVISAELLASASSIFTISWSMLASASIR